MATRHSVKIDLISKAKEAMLSAVQAFNNPLATFKTETFIVLSNIAWTYLIHAYFKQKKIDYRYIDEKNSGGKRKYLRNKDGSYRYWDLAECLGHAACPVDEAAKQNIIFLIGLRNQIEHQKPSGLDSYMSARYQACALNFNFYIKKMHGEKFGLDEHMALSLQFAELDYSQADAVKNKEKLIPSNIKSYVAEFDSKLTNGQLNDERFAYRLLFTKVMANRAGQADRVIEFIDPESELAKTISKEFWVKKETEKEKFRVKDLLKKVHEAGFADFGVYQHTQLWQKEKAKDPNKGFGIYVTEHWYWYQKWVDFIISKLKQAEKR